MVVCRFQVGPRRKVEFITWSWFSNSIMMYNQIYISFKHKIFTRSQKNLYHLMFGVPLVTGSWVDLSFGVDIKWVLISFELRSRMPCFEALTFCWWSICVLFFKCCSTCKIRAILKLWLPEVLLHNACSQQDVNFIWIVFIWRGW